DQHRRRRQEALRPILMGLQKTKEPRPLGEAGEQRPRVARQPALIMASATPGADVPGQSTELTPERGVRGLRPSCKGPTRGRRSDRSPTFIAGISQTARDTCVIFVVNEGKEGRIRKFKRLLSPPPRRHPPAAR